MLNRSQEIVLMGLLLASLAGCATGGAGPSAVGPARAAGVASPEFAPADALSAFLNSAAPGSSASIPTADGGVATVAIEREYHAASGRSCRRIRLAPPLGRAEERVACRDGFGMWRLLPPLLNRALPALSAPSEVGLPRAPGGRAEPAPGGAS